MTDQLDWNDLRYFLAAARAGTLAGAARALGVKHSTIGRRLSALERALGAAVVLRGSDGLRLTAIGETLVPHAEEIERIAAALQKQAQTRIATVRLAVPSGFVKLLAPHVAELRREHPGLALEILSGSRPVDLNKGEAELALRGGTPGGDSLIARKVAEAGWSLYAAPAYLARKGTPRDVRDLAGHEVLGFDPALAQMPGAQWLAAHGAGASIALHHREMVDMVAAAVAGIGLAVLPCIAAYGEPGLQRLTREVLGRNPMYLVYRREVGAAKPVQTVLRFVADVMRKNARALRG